VRHNFAANSTAEPLSLVFSVDGKLLAIGWTGGRVRVYAVGDEAPVRHIGPGKGKDILALAFSPDGAILAWGLEDRTFQLNEILSGKTLRTLTGHPGRVTALAFSPNGKRLASGDGNGVIRLWR